MPTPTPSSLQQRRVATTRPPAKLNLFLELLSRRADGYHEIDTVMVPIDWTDHLSLQRTSSRGIDLRVDWSPSIQVIAQRLGIEDAPRLIEQMLSIPPSSANLVYQSLERFQQYFGVAGGFACHLRKQIPAGAGMGGASSDAASALECAARLCGFDSERTALHQLAASIGSDVPFFLGGTPESRPSERGQASKTRAARATGRGEQIQGIQVGGSMHFVVVYPCLSLSTAAVYNACTVLDAPESSAALISALHRVDYREIGANLINRLVQPAEKIGPQITEIRKSMWRCGLQACQLTGSGSASFGIALSSRHARRCAARLRACLQPGALVKVTHSTSVPASVFFEE